MKHAYIFPGQGAQFTGMGKNLYEENTLAREYFEQANEILGFRITDVMFSGSEDDLKQTEVTQPAIFLHSAILFETTPNLLPDMVAGHSLGEISALVACKALTFEDGLKLVSRRALAMQHACVKNPSTMAAILGMDDAKVQEITGEFKDDGVVVANYNCPGQVIISGSIDGIEKASERFKAAGAKQVVTLKVGGGFHSPHMEPAREEFAQAVANTTFNNPHMPGIPKCGRSPIHRSKYHQAEPDQPAYFTCTLDTDHAENAGPWRYPIYRGRPGTRITGLT
jgi:[acyl-carrier-protein] S-malonyltransferase